MTISPLERATEEFADQLSRWRVERGLSKRALAIQMGFDPSYVSHVEGRRHRPTEDFARRAESALSAGGAIWDSYEAYEALRQTAPANGARLDQAPRQVPGIGLVVEREDAALGLHHDTYHIVIRRHLHNVGTEPIVRYPVRVRVDRYPNHPRRSARTHHGAPLTWSELGFTARRIDTQTGEGGPDDAGGGPEPMTWRASHDADTVKELWLQFANGERHFPLYPGQRATIEYGYRVTSDKWGPWFQRAIRLPTRELRIELDFPAEAQAAVWGTVSSLSAEDAPLATPIGIAEGSERTTFSWSVRDPVLAARYRFEWRLRE
jgi:transcriptional regulator with XRE-family HTH domain